MSFGVYVIFGGLIVAAIGITSAALQGANAQSWSYFLIVIGILLFIIGILLLSQGPSTSPSTSTKGISNAEVVNAIAKAK